MGVKLKNAILTMLDAMAGIAFTGAKPTADSLGLTTPSYGITLNIGTGASASNNAATIYEGSTYTNTISAEAGYGLQSVAVTMGGVDVTASTYDSGTGIITIASVTGVIVITVTAQQLVARTITLPSGTGIEVEDTDGNALSGTATAYDGAAWSCVVRCSNGYAFDSAPTLTGATITQQTDGSYLVSLASVSADATVAATASAISVFTAGGLNYNILTDTSTAEVTVCSGTSDADANANTGDKYTGAIEIPATANYHGASYSVIKVGTRAFYGCTGVTSMILNEGLTTIEDSAFRNCSGMSSCNFPSTLTSLGTSAFNKSGITAIDLTSCSDITVGAYCFNNCTSCTSLTFKQGGTIRLLADGAAGYNFGSLRITSLVLNCTIRYGAANYAFVSCTTLESITFTADHVGISNSWELPNGTFLGVGSITDIYVHKASPLTSTNSTNNNSCPFGSTPRANATLHIPTGADVLAAYQNTDNAHDYCWQHFTNIVQGITL